MERYLVIWCPDLLEQKEQGREQRAFFRVVEAVSSLTTRIETVRPGVCAVPTRGPSRYFGGDLSLCKEVADRVASAVPGARAGVGVGVADGLFAAVLAARSASAAPQHDDALCGVLVVPPEGPPPSSPLGLSASSSGRAGGSSAQARDPDPRPVRRPALQARACPVWHRRGRLSSEGNGSHRGAAGSPGSSGPERPIHGLAEEGAPVSVSRAFGGAPPTSDKRRPPLSPAYRETSAPKRCSPPASRVDGTLLNAPSCCL